jgi:hypothetical protein
MVTEMTFLTTKNELNPQKPDISSTVVEKPKHESSVDHPIEDDDLPF